MLVFGNEGSDILSGSEPGEDEEEVCLFQGFVVAWSSRGAQHLGNSE